MPGLSNDQIIKLVSVRAIPWSSAGPRFLAKIGIHYLHGKCYIAAVMNVSFPQSVE